jgi:thiosulfate/3-mercaptopyruvate sulfurtransferase
MRIATVAAALLAGLTFTTAAHAERLTDQPLVDSAWLQQHLDNESLVVLDVRDAAENVSPYATGHIPGAISAPYSTSGWRLEVDGVPGQFPGVEPTSQLIGNLGIDNDDHVVIVPKGTDSTEIGAATRVYWTFKVLGHDAVSILDGGARAWEAAGGPLTAEATTREPTTFTADFRSELLATTADVQQALSSNVKLVDGRPAAQYRGEAKSPVVATAGTLPGAVNIEHSTLYDASAAAFADSETVASLAAAVGLDADDPNIAFCNTGHWASVAWFGLSEVLGNKNTRMYDGSMSEWTTDPSRPVEAGQ